MRHGKGIWKDREEGKGAIYEGEYHLDKKEGQGTYTWPSGNYYKGNFVNDLRQGYGEMYWVDGSWFKGHWDKGI